MPDAPRAFIDDVELVLDSTDDEREITRRVADRLSGLLASGYRLPPELTRPSRDHHVTYPLHIDPGDRWSMVSVVWAVGQRTPVHSHETWGVAGIYSGAERETRYLKPTGCPAARPLTPAGEELYAPGQVTVCCTTDDDVHSVEAVGTEPTVGIHVYGGNIATLRRRSYDPATGEAHWFVSGWEEQSLGAPHPARDVSAKSRLRRVPAADSKRYHDVKMRRDGLQAEEALPDRARQAAHKRGVLMALDVRTRWRKSWEAGPCGVNG